MAVTAFTLRGAAINIDIRKAFTERRPKIPFFRFALNAQKDAGVVPVHAGGIMRLICVKGITKPFRPEASSCVRIPIRAMRPHGAAKQGLIAYLHTGKTGM